MTYILDASVVLKWVAQEKEEHVDCAFTILQDIIENRMFAVIPDLLLAEFANILLIGKKFPKEKIDEAMTSLVELPIEIRPVTYEMILTAITFAKMHTLTIYDAVYIALAKEYKTQVITADKKVSSIKDMTIYLGEYE